MTEVTELERGKFVMKGGKALKNELNQSQNQASEDIELLPAAIDSKRARCVS